MQGLSRAVHQHEQLLKLLRANLLGSEPCPAPALPGTVVGMCMRYQQSVAAMVKSAAPVSLTGAFQKLPQLLLLSGSHALQTDQVPHCNAAQEAGCLSSVTASTTRKRLITFIMPLWGLELCN